MIDFAIANVTLQANVRKYLSDELSQVDFQSENQLSDIPKDESGTEEGFVPQQDYDESNKFLMQTKYGHMKQLACPLAQL